jgi:curved DNA-binding protein CbpA
MNRHFTILFLPETANIQEVKKAYRKLVKIHHPDKNSGSKESTEKFRIIQEAYEKILKYFETQNISNHRTDNGFKEKSNQTKTDSKSEKANTNSNKTHTKSDDQTKTDFNSEKTNTNSNKTHGKSDTSNSHDEKQNTRKDRFKSNNSDLGKNPKIVKTHAIGEDISVGYFEYVVNKSYYSKIIGENYFKSEADGIYLLIELKILNKSNIQRKLHNYMFRLSTSENDFFEFSSKGLSAIVMSGIKSIDFFGKELNPKISSIVNLIFEVSDRNSYFLNLCGGEYDWAENSICICKEIEVVSVT